MYCPKCSQQQVSDEIRFCSRCGFQLDAVKTMLAENQNTLTMPEAVQQSELVTTRKRDILLGATVMLVGAISIALLMISAWAGTPWQAVIIPLLMVWAAIAFVLLLSGHAVREIKKLFSRDASVLTPRDASSFVTQVSAATRHQALPHIQSAPVSGQGTWRLNTAELVQPPSITDQTTNLLDKKR
jgi:hypothetical protein